MLKSAIIVGLFGLSQCGKDETVAGYGGAGQVWELTGIDGTAFSATATVTFPEPGKIAGKAPCNSYTGKMDAPYPWFETGPLAATRMACPDLEAETMFFTALGEMSQSEAAGEILILSNEAGREMVFKTTP